MKDKKDEARLLIATFIIATTFAFLAMQVKTSWLENELFKAIILLVVIAMVVSSVASFIFIITKATELKYNLKKKLMVHPAWHAIHTPRQ